MKSVSASFDFARKAMLCAAVLANFGSSAEASDVGHPADENHPVKTFEILPVRPAPAPSTPKALNPNRPLSPIEQYRAYQLAELGRLNVMEKWYQAVFTSLEASRYFVNPTGNEIGNLGVQSAAVVTLVMTDIALVNNWIALMKNPYAFQITPQAAQAANRTTRQVLQDAVLRFARGVRNRTIAFAQNSPKTFQAVSTTAIGVIGFAHIEGFYVINMDEAKYQTLVKAVTQKLAELRAEQARLANTYTPVAVP